jgi:bacteriocin-like protein
MLKKTNSLNLGQKKLSLRKETLRQLNEQELSKVVGGSANEGTNYAELTTSRICD